MTGDKPGAMAALSKAIALTDDDAVKAWLTDQYSIYLSKP